MNYDVRGGQGLSAVYANGRPKVDHFAEIDPIGGLPSVQYWDNDENRACSTVVGLADEYAVVMTLTIGTKGAEQGDDPCEAARTVMDRVVGNLKAKA
ncbi:hypothetical protein FB384_001165 [Prauserella sediminis]|uniref:DUF3558 domain-containing protein n=1 Tax=Prauserella sediminis TaxID=577680 RepID=A0A839XHN1_9PSEU|nr:hypothetical protein [Prauserella sediminis]